MTRKDFVLIARALRTAQPLEKFHTDRAAFNILSVQWRTDCQYLAAELGRDNPRFERYRFLEACGVEVPS